MGAGRSVLRVLVGGSVLLCGAVLARFVIAHEPEFRSPQALTAKSRYDRAIQEATTRYVQDLRAALQSATRRADLAEVAAIQAEIERLSPEEQTSPIPGRLTSIRQATGGPVEGQDWTSPSTGMEFVWIPRMRMWVGKYEVTNGEYRRMHPSHDSGANSGHSLNGDRQPVVRVNFDDATAYAEWLTEQDAGVLGGVRYRLPSDDEFTRYAQCGRNWEYPWGNNWPPRSGQAGNYHGEEGARRGERGIIEGYNDGHPVSCDVEESWENPWGLFGVGGNVWEACASDSTGGSIGAWRGASWFFSHQGNLRVSDRTVRGGSFRNDDRGFRLVLAQQ